MKRYEGYKETGVGWIGEIPATWDLVKVKNAFAIQKRIVGFDGPDVLSITQKGIVKKDIKSGEGQLAESYKNYQWLYPGEFAMNHMDLLTGWVDCSSYEGVTSPDYRVFTPTISLDRRFYTYLFQHCYSAKVFYGFGQGVSNFGRWRLPADEFKSFLIPFPPIETQKAISTYLDIKTAEIDTLIEETEKSIELLEEYRKSAISEAVTKGLDPDVPMKDSCIEWIGEIPAHWDICRLGLLVHFHSGKPKEALMKSEDAIYPVYGGGDVKGYSEEFNIDGENVLVSRQGATCGTTRYVIGKAWATEHALIANPSSSIEPKWLSLWLENMNLGQYSMTAAQPGIAASMIESLPMVVLPKEEQAAISETVKELSNEIRATIAQKLLLIQYCHDLRKSLVGEAITGKFKVPGVM